MPLTLAVLAGIERFAPLLVEFCVDAEVGMSGARASILAQNKPASDRAC